MYMLFLIVTSLIIIIVSIAILIILNKTSSKSSKCSDKNIPAELFNSLEIIKSKLTDNQINSGVLVHMFALEDMEDLNNKKDFTFNLQTPGTADCGGISLKACSAWTFMRKDIPPMIFTYPVSSSIDKNTNDKLWKSIVGVKPNGQANKEMIGSGEYWTPNCAVILDAKKAWPLLTTMGIIDSGTDERNCLSNGRGAENCVLAPNKQFDEVNNIWWPSVPNQKMKPSKSSNIGVIQQALNKGANCPTSCNKLYPDGSINNKYCKYRVAGGGLSKLNLNSYKWNWDENDTRPNIYNTFLLEQSLKEDIKAKNACGVNDGSPKFLEWTPGKKSFARNPYICVTEKTPTDNDSISNDILVNTFNEDSSLDVIYNYVGSNFSDGNYIEQSNKDNNNNNGNTFAEQYYNGINRINYPLGTSTIQNFQCKWEKKDFNRWISEIKNFWFTVFKTLNKDNMYVNDPDNWGKNVLLANPNIYWEYFENEVNVFIDPSINDDNDKYNKIYRDSIIGFGFFPKTMSEQLQEIPNLDNITIRQDNLIYKNIKDRVMGVTNGTGYLVGVGNSPDVIKDICNYEKARLLRGKEIMNIIKNKFNKKYNKNVSLYKLNTYCPILQNYSLLKQTFNGELDGHNIFIKHSN